MTGLFSRRKGRLRMKINELGHSGLRVSEVGFGTAPIGIKDYNEMWDPESEAGYQSAMRALNSALDDGINLIDTAPMYGDGAAERSVGEAIGHRRGEFILATKLSPPASGWRRLDADHVLRQFGQSMIRLQTDYADIYQLHGDTWDHAEAEAVIDSEGMRQIVRLKEEGSVRCIGVTSESPQSVVPFLKSGIVDVVQIKYNLIYQEAYHELLPLAEKLGVGVMVMRPLTSGIFQKMMRFFYGESTEQTRDLHEMALKYVLSDSRVHCSIVGMRRQEEVRANLAIARSYTARMDLDTLHSRQAKDHRMKTIQTEVSND